MQSTVKLFKKRAFLSQRDSDIDIVAIVQGERELVFISAKYLTPYSSYLKDYKKIFVTALVNNKIFGLEEIYKCMFENIFSPVLDRYH